VDDITFCIVCGGYKEAGGCGTCTCDMNENSEETMEGGDMFSVS